MSQYFVAIDLGTTGTKAVVFDAKGNIVGSGTFNTPTYFPAPGRVEQDPQEVVALLYSSVKAAVADSGVDPKDIAGIAFSHMCCTFVPVDKDGKFLNRIILWNDFRGAEMFPYMRERLATKGISDLEDYNYTGYPFGPLATTPKFLWIKKNLPDVYEKTYKFVGMEALMISSFTGNIKEYYDDRPGIIYTKISNGSTFKLDPDRAKLYDIDINKYADRKDPGEFVGKVTAKVAALSGLAEGTPVYVGVGDQRCAAVGAGVAKDGMISGVLGTAGVIHAYSSKPVRHAEGKISIMGHAGTGHWQVEGSSSSGASSLRWYRDLFSQTELMYSNLMSEDIYDILSRLAEKSPVGSNGIIYTPWLAGCDCPRFDENGRATFTGLSFSHNKSDICRSIMEGVCYEMRSMIDDADKTLGSKTQILRSVGGGARSRLWNQIQADVYNKSIETVRCEEATALGAAMFAAIGAGVYKDVHEAIDNMVQVKYRLDPIQENVAVYEELYKIYCELYEDLSKRVFPDLKKFQDKHFKK
jgi:xylulokinase